MAAGDPLHEFLHAIPKAELHCQLFNDGAGVPQTTGDFVRVTYEHLRDAAAHNVRYSEFSWNPIGTVRESRRPYAELQAAILEGAAMARADFGIHGRLVPAIDRQASPAEAIEMVRWVIGSRHEDVPGIGLVGREPDRPPELFVHAFALARAAGLRATAQAGASGAAWTNVRTAIEQLRVDRIGHGYALVEHPEYAARCAELGIVFTVVPSDPHGVRAPDPPVRRMPSIGLRIHPNAGDRGLRRVTPTHAWLSMVRDFGFGLDPLRGFMINGIDAAWIDDATKGRWRREWTGEFDRLRQLHAPDGSAG